MERQGRSRSCAKLFFPEIVGINFSCLINQLASFGRLKKFLGRARHSAPVAGLCAIERDAPLVTYGARLFAGQLFSAAVAPQRYRRSEVAKIQSGGMDRSQSRPRRPRTLTRRAVDPRPRTWPRRRGACPAARPLPSASNPPPSAALRAVHEALCGVVCEWSWTIWEARTVGLPIKIALFDSPKIGEHAR
jgi:hypothetical protein